MLEEFMFPLFEVWGRYYEVGQSTITSIKKKRTRENSRISQVFSRKLIDK